MLQIIIFGEDLRHILNILLIKHDSKWFETFELLRTVSNILRNFSVLSHKKTDFWLFSSNN